MKDDLTVRAKPVHYWDLNTMGRRFIRRHFLSRLQVKPPLYDFPRLTAQAKQQELGAASEQLLNVARLTQEDWGRFAERYKRCLMLFMLEAKK